MAPLCGKGLNNYERHRMQEVIEKLPTLEVEVLEAAALEVTSLDAAGDLGFN